ncbi:Cut9 interacting protein Scn1 [Strigomonas culicis]|uniref:Cut9 interacting protein Scn1 n=1 Tax=Strigomonas culicis TaxID=28005 RepID=S9TJ71_9TRYP|nr:Cut9 interacting protein Scn1 [Strigomonas culicis]|eukprot:EPY16919.1 Cut9 interacting protein Scn1 [Strigomonas culicis]
MPVPSTCAGGDTCYRFYDAFHEAAEDGAVTEANICLQVEPIHYRKGFGTHSWFIHELDSPFTDKSFKTLKTDAATTPIGDLIFSEANKKILLEQIIVPLEAHLRAYPNAIVGEIGLDKLYKYDQHHTHEAEGVPCRFEDAARNSEFSQVLFFILQLKLAGRHGRPVSLHCVQHYGLLLSLFENKHPLQLRFAKADRAATADPHASLFNLLLFVEDVPPAIVIHGFTGSSSVLQSFLKLKHIKASFAPEPTMTTPPAVKIKNRIVCGIGASTSCTVRNFTTETLPLLIANQNFVLESDLHYHVLQLRGDPPSAPSAACQTVPPVFSIAFPMRTTRAKAAASEEEDTVLSRLYDLLFAKEKRQGESICTLHQQFTSLHGHIRSEDVEANFKRIFETVL